MDLGCIIRGGKQLRGRLRWHGLALHVLKVGLVHVELRVKGIHRGMPKGKSRAGEGRSDRSYVVRCRGVGDVWASGRMLVVSGVKLNTALGNLARKDQRGCADDGDDGRLVMNEVAV